MSATQPAEPVYSLFQDDEDFRELLVDFEISVRDRRGVLQESFQSGAIHNIRTQAHQLKGSGGGYGFEELSLLASDLEQVCNEPQPSLDRIGPLLDQVVDYLSRIRI